MNYYQDIKLLPDKEFNLPTLRNSVCQKLHYALYDLNTGKIAIDFPEVAEQLGRVIRIHASKEDLDKLAKLRWLGGLVGYCAIGDIFSVPASIDGYQRISRIRQTMTEAKLRQRILYQTERKDLETPEDVQAYKNQYRAKMMETSLDNPYLELTSSKGGRYRIYLEFGKIQSDPIEGEFNNFGISKTATVPIF